MPCTFSPDPIQLAVMEATLAGMPDKIATAGRDALNRTMEEGRTAASRELAVASGATKGAISKRLGIARATKANVSAALIVRGGTGLSLAGFSARQTDAGVMAKVFGESRLYPRLFLKKGLSGNKVVFDRLRNTDKYAPTKGAYAGRKFRRGPRAGEPILRQHVEARYGPAASQIIENTPGADEHVSMVIDAAFSKNIQQQTARFAFPV